MEELGNFHDENPNSFHYARRDITETCPALHHKQQQQQHQKLGRPSQEKSVHRNRYIVQAFKLKYARTVWWYVAFDIYNLKKK